MAMKMEQKKVTYDHAVDHMTDTRKEIPRTVSAQPNASLTEAIDAVGNPNRLQCQYVVGKTPTVNSVSPRTIESLRPGNPEY